MVTINLFTFRKKTPVYILGIVEGRFNRRYIVSRGQMSDDVCVDTSHASLPCTLPNTSKRTDLNMII